MHSILIDSAMNEPWSFGVVGMHLALALDRLGWDVYIRPWRREAVEAAGGRLAQLLTKGNRPCDLHLRFSHPDSFDAIDGERRIGFGVFETTRVPDSWVEACNRMTGVLVPSTFCRAVLLSHGVKVPIGVAPHGIDPSLYPCIERPKRSTFTFLSLAAAQHRKGTALLIDAFRAAFPNEPDVRLRLVSTPPYQLESFRVDDPRIEYHFGEMSWDDVAAHYHSADSFVLPTRAEGFGMPVLEAMATGLPTIVTGWSGVLDFCTPENAYLIHVAGIEPAFEGRPEQGLWVRPDETHLQTLLRHVYYDRDEARHKGWTTGQEIQRHWTWLEATRRFTPFLESLLK